MTGETGFGGDHVPDLSELGIEEAEPGCCEDTYENRRILRTNKWFFEPVGDENGSPTGLIRAFDPEAMVERRLAVHDRKKPILMEPENPWSDYLPALDLPNDADVPAWIRGVIRKYVTERSQGVPEEKLPLLPVRCETVRVDGTRCWNWAARPDGVPRCRSHLSWKAEVDQKRLNAARLRIIQAAPAAVDTLEVLMESAAGEAVRMKAATELLDRAGIRGGIEISQEVTVEVVDPAAVVRERLTQLANNAKAAAELEARIFAESQPPVIEGEVIETPES